MKSFFKILSSVQWEESKISGLINRSEMEGELDSFLVYRFSDLERVCKHYFEPQDYPIALEIAPDSYSAEWKDSKSIMDCKQGHVASEHLLSDLVLNIYSFEAIQKDDSFKFILQGE